MSGIQIRKAKPDDAEAMAELTVAAWQTAYTGVLDPAYLPSRKTEHYTAKFQEIISGREWTVLAGEWDGRVVGFTSGLLISEGAYDCEVKGLYVHPDYQGKGIGRKLLEAMLHHFQSLGCQHAIIWTLLGVKNNGFYRRMGGTAEQGKEQELGDRKYRMVGFSYRLTESSDDTSRELKIKRWERKHGEERADGNGRIKKDD